MTALLVLRVFNSEFVILCVYYSLRTTNIPQRLFNNMIKSLSISGFRGFSKRICIDFAIPNEIEGSGLTILTGANNSGKTSIVEALRCFNGRLSNNEGPSFNENQRNVSTNGVVEINIKEHNGTECTIKTKYGGSRTEKTNQDFCPHYYIVQSRRGILYEFSRASVAKEYYVENSMNFSKRDNLLNNFNQRIFKIEEYKTEFNQLFWNILGYKLEWMIDQHENGNFYLKCKIGDQAHTGEGLGDGCWSAFVISAALFDSKPDDVIVIDEPELSLHPAVQKRLMNKILEYSKTRQIILSTHSPYFVSWDAIICGGTLIRVVNQDDRTECYSTNNIFQDKCRKIKNDLNNPHLLGLDSNEVFFLEDNIILVEGQEDVVIYQKILNQLKIDLEGTFFGWGAGGADRMEHFLTLFKILGYKHVVAILDSDKNKTAEKLRLSFSEYRVESISCPDIRDKESRSAQSKKGITTKDGKLKQEYENEMKQLFNNIENYFKESHRAPFQRQGRGRA